ncbi:MAG TPA: Rrf2 family transcriptional regulator [Syntrophorhabdaceae bacterium]|nr:Rrf2 family transcriptional regulator [Syntrophorhabdaceae bacterium]
MKKYIIPINIVGDIMKISTKGRYGLRAMIDIAANSTDGAPVFLSEIAKRQGVSEKYLEHIFSILHKAGLVKAIRGRKGGYLLQREPDGISLYEIISALEGPCTLVDCVNDLKICSKAETCITRDIWKLLGERIEGYLKDYNLSALVRMQANKVQQDNIMYHI